MSAACTQVDYGYGPKNGPHTWCLTCSAAAGASQSPINIVRHNCFEDTSLKPLKMKILQEGAQLFTRKKHNFQVSFPQTKDKRKSKERGKSREKRKSKDKLTYKAASLAGGPLKAGQQYRLEQFHCHWGYEDQWGSEHQVDGHSFAGELHLVFVNERFVSLPEAMTDPEGLCVVGIFLKAGDSDCEAFKPLISAIKSSQPNCEKIIEKAIDIKSLIPSTSRYFTYTGSLTTPPCTECVRWIVCAQPLTISKEQLNAMRSMHSCADCHTNENFRPPMPVGNRKVMCSFKQKFD